MLTSIKEIILGLLMVLVPFGSTIDYVTMAPQLVLPAVPQCVALNGAVIGVGSTGIEVKEIQKILNITPDTRVAKSGPGSPGNETEYFGLMTKNAVVLFQQKHSAEILTPAGLVAGTGVVGKNSRTKIRQICERLISSGLTQADIVSSIAGTVSAISKPYVDTTQILTQTKGVCGLTMNVCSGGLLRDISDSKSSYRWMCTGSASRLSVSCSVPKSKVQTTPPVTSPTSAVPIQVTPATGVTTSSLEWGVFSGYTTSDLTAFESLVGKPVKLRSIFTNWNEPFPASVGAGLKPSNKTLVIFWEQYGVTLDSIIAGDSDAYIKQFAADANAYGGPVILAPLHEMNGNWDSWGGTVGQNNPQKVVLAWKHIHDVFGTTSNVKFAWAVNNESVPNTAANAIGAYYPGDDYVDYVAVDGFNFGNPWQSFDTVFGKALTTVSVYKKPIYILSMASAAGTQKSAWITDAVTVQMKKYPLLKGWIWFNENKEQDWRINSDTTSLAAFKSAL